MNKIVWNKMIPKLKFCLQEGCANGCQILSWLYSLKSHFVNKYDATTLSKMTFCIMTLSATILMWPSAWMLTSIMTALSMQCHLAACIFFNVMLWVVMLNVIMMNVFYAECRCAECHFAKCLGIILKKQKWSFSHLNQFCFVQNCQRKWTK